MKTLKMMLLSLGFVASAFAGGDHLPIFNVYSATVSLTKNLEHCWMSVDRQEDSVRQAFFDAKKKCEEAQPEGRCRYGKFEVVKDNQTEDGGKTFQCEVTATVFRVNN